MSEYKVRLGRRRLLKGLAGCCLPGVSSIHAESTAFPSRPIRLICPWPPGGASDVAMRAIAESASKALGGTVVIDNKPGAGGMLGPIELVNAKPDGYTLSQLTIVVARLPHIQKAAFDPLRDFTYIVGLTGYTFGLVVRADSAIRSLQDLVDYAKARPSQFTYGSPGVGTTLHLVVEDFASKAGIRLVHVPYKGNSDGMQALMGGHIMAYSDSTGWAPQVDAGTCRLLVTFGSKRTRRWPTVPTLNELGYDIVTDSPYGIGGPKGMDPLITTRLHDAFKRTLDDPAVLSTFERLDQPVVYMGTDEYTQFMREQYAREKAMVERAGLALKN